jgi:hypothetical protein
MMGLLVSKFVYAFNATKKNGSTIQKEEVQRFFNTLEALRPRDKFSTSIMVSGVSYHQADYQLDGRFNVLVQPRAVMLTPTDLFNGKDLSGHSEQTMEEVMTPSQFIEFQYRVLNGFKTQPNLSPLESRVVGLDSIKVFVNGDKVLVLGDNSYDTLPTEINIADSLFEAEAFNLGLDEYITRCMLVMFSKFAAKATNG